MWECDICGKNKVNDKGFRCFIKYGIVSFYNPPEIEPEKIAHFGSVIRQIRICDKCLDKKGKNLEIKL